MENLPRRFMLFVAIFLLFCLYGCGSKSFMIKGIVIDDQQNDVSGAEVKVTMLQATGGQEIIPPLKTKTESDGSYQLEGLIAGQYKLEASKAGYDPAEPRTELFTETDTGIDFKLRKQLTLTGVIYDTDGVTPIREAMVILTKADGESITRKTDNNGEFTIDEVYSNEVYTITAYYQDDKQAKEREIRFEDFQQPIELTVVESKTIPRSDDLEDKVTGKTGTRK
jgi:hypothetical protein